MRNGKKDELRMAALRETMLAEGFRLFSERGIEAVGMQEVAKACHLGIATLYRYFGTKLDLVLAIGERKWAEYGDYARALHRVRNAEAMTAAEELDFYLDFYLDLYEHHKDLLRFNQNFNNYVQHEGATAAQLEPYLLAVSGLGGLVRNIYEKGRRDGTIRTDVDAEKLFTATSHITLAVVVRFAQGVLYDAEREADRTEELRLLKKMLLREFVV